MGFTFFSRTRPSTEALAAMLNKANSAPAPSAPPLGSAKVPALTPAVSQLPIIKDLSEVPGGRYSSFKARGIPESFADSFALLFNGETAVILLTAAEALGTHPQFELQRRLQVEGGVNSVTVRQATQEIIQIVHKQNRTVEAVEDTKVETAAWDMIEDALEKEASDIHIETRETHAQLFFRIHGERVEQPIMTKEKATAICNVLAGVHADADNKGVDWDPKTVQDTVVPYKSRKGVSVQLRFSSGPIFPSGNFHAVMRVLEMDAEGGRKLEEIGYTPGQVEVIEGEALLGAQGLVGLLGPTNSGKSSSMQAFIERTYDRRGDSIKVITVEDPVEYVIPRACQMGVVTKENAQAVYKQFLKGTLRQDPDVVMAGEIRDSEGAENLMHLVLAGRKLFTSIHVYDVMAGFTRLRELGIPESVLFMEGFISAFICQRLVPLLCPSCSIPIGEAVQQRRIQKPTFDRVARVADLHEHDICVRGDGCPECHYRGIKGRTLCAEVLVPDATFLALMAQGKTVEARNYWMTNSPALNIEDLGVTMIAHAIHKMRQGLIDPSHIETYIGKIVVDTPIMGAGQGRGADFPPSLAS